MLNSFRKASETPIVKYVLFGLLILAFGGFWGVGGLGTILGDRAANQPAIKVGDISIPAPQVVEEFRRSVEQMQPMFGGKLTIDQARQIGLLDRTIEQLVSRTLLDENARDLGIVVDDETLRTAIAQFPAFQDEQTKAFSKERYQAILASSGLSEQQFLNIERGDLARSVLEQSIASGIRAPSALVDPLFRYNQEKRIGDVVSFQAGQTKPATMPDDSVLKAFIDVHKAQFTAPETRALTAILVNANDLMAAVKPSEADINQAYQAHQAEYTVPEKRAVQQALFNDKNTAQALVDAVKAGKPFAEAAAGHADDLGPIGRDELPLPQLADAVFGASGAGVVGPVQTALGWHVLFISKIIPEHVQPLAEIHDKVVAELSRDDAAKRVYDVSNKIEDSIGSGASVEETAGNLGLKTLKVASIDHSGKGLDGKNVPGVPASNAFLATAFQTDKGSTSEVTPLENDGGYFVVRVDSVTPAALKPFAAIKDQAFAAWSQQQQDDQAYKQAEAGIERLKKGDSLASVAGTSKIESTPALTRDGSEPATALLAAELFRLKPGEAAAFRSETGGSKIVVLKTIVQADPKQDQPGYTKTQKDLGQTLAQGMVDQYLAALQRQYPVSVNRTLIAQQFSQQ